MDDGFGSGHLQIGDTPSPLHPDAEPITPNTSGIPFSHGHGVVLDSSFRKGKIIYHVYSTIVNSYGEGLHICQFCAMVIQRVTQSTISCSGESSGVVLWS